MNQLPLIDELRGLIQSLKNFDTLAAARVTKKPNVVDRLHQAAPTVPLEVGEATTLGLAEAIAAVDPNRPLPEKLAEFVKEYDAWLRSSEGMDRLDAIKEANWDNTWNQYYEFQLLDSYRNDSNVPLDAAKLAFEVRRLGEQVAADLLSGQGWGAETIDAADRFRLEAERLLVDHADAQWLDKATGNLQRARTLYADAQTKVANVHQAAQLLSGTLIRARDYLRWCRFCWGDAASRAPTAQRIESLLISLKDLRDALDPSQAGGSPNRSDLQRIQDEIERQLAQGVDELASSPYEPGDSERISALLKTALLNADQRAKCIDARIEADADLMRGFEVSLPTSAIVVPPTNATRDKLAVDQIRAERLLLETFSPRTLDKTEEWPGMEQSDTVAILAASKLLGDWLYDLNGVVSSQAEANSNLADLNRRPARLEQLRRAVQGLYLIDALDANSPSPEESTVVQRVRNAMWYDLLNTTHNRFGRAQADATPEEVAALRQLANRCGAAASQIPDQPEIMNVDAPQLALQVPSAAAELIAVDEATIDFTVQSFGQDGPVWVVAQYDTDAIEVTGVNWTILSERDIEAAQINENSQKSAGYPYWPQAHRGVSATMTLTAGQSRKLGVKVRRLSNARGNTTLVLKAVSDKDYIRQQMPVRLPGRQDLEISIAGAQIDSPQSGKQSGTVRQSHPRALRLPGKHGD